MKIENTHTSYFNVGLDKQAQCPSLKLACVNLHYLDQNFKEMADDLIAKQEHLTSTQFRYALEVVLAIGLLNSNRESIINVSDESERNNKITNLTGLIAEPGLVSGLTSDEVLESLEQRIDLLKTSYLVDKENDDTISLWRDGFIGPPCFNGRMITLQEYRSQKQLLIDRSSIDNLVTVSDQTDYDEKALEMVELMYEFNYDELPEKSEFKKFIESSDKEGFLIEYDKLYRRAVELYV